MKNQLTENSEQETVTRKSFGRLFTVHCSLSATAQPRGFTLLIAVLVASLMLVLAGSMFNLVQKELILSSIGKDSQFAFYAADSALECALYWDFRLQAFSDPAGGIPIVCNNVAIGSIAYQGLEIPMTFQFDSGGYCAKVSVVKHASYPRTTIQARGYNAPCAGLAGNLRSLERAVAVNY